MMSAAMGCTAGARQTAMTAISKIKIERGELAAERTRTELDAYKAAHDGLTPFEVARRSHDSQAMPDDRMEPGIEPTLF